jgi:hypothetical protein
MHRRRGRLGPLSRSAALVASTAVLAAGCLGGQGSPSPSSTGAVPSPSRPEATASATAAPTTSAGPTAAPFDPAAISVTLEAYVTVPGAPLAITSPHDGSGRLFVATKAGQVRIVRDGVLQTDPMLDISSLVSTGGEQGLLGIAVHPDFPDHPRVVVDYTDVNGDTVVVAYRLDPADRPARSGSATTIWPSTSRSRITTAGPSPSGRTGTSTSPSATAAAAAIRRTTASTSTRSSARSSAWTSTRPARAAPPTRSRRATPSPASAGPGRRSG